MGPSPCQPATFAISTLDWGATQRGNSSCICNTLQGLRMRQKFKHLSENCDLSRWAVNNTGGGDIELSGPTVFAEYPRPHAKPDGLYILAQPRLARRG